MQISQFVLYHGSDTDVKHPVWNSGSRYRDFGQCFYTTYDRETAKDWAEKIGSLFPIVNRYALSLKHMQTANLRVKRFDANAEWAQFVYNNRENPRFHRPAYRYTYDTALDVVLSSNTYNQLVTHPHLQEEGSLYICELLEKEIQ